MISHARRSIKAIFASAGAALNLERGEGALDIAEVVKGEAVGTFLLVFFGTGAVASSVLTGALTGLWQVASVWGFGICLAIYVSAPLSGAHLNPAVTLAFALFRHQSFRPIYLFPYWLAQVAGATAAGAAIAIIFAPLLTRFETANRLVRGTDGSELSAMIFGQHFPNPAIFGTDVAARMLVSPALAFAVEGLSTAILVLVIFALTDPRNRAIVPPGLVPFFIGFTVAVLISLFAPLTQAGFNPARDLGPRLVAWMLGWGSIAFPGPQNEFWVYLLGPLVGGPVGAAAWQLMLRSVEKEEATEDQAALAPPAAVAVIEGPWETASRYPPLSAPQHMCVRHIYIGH